MLLIQYQSSKPFFLYIQVCLSNDVTMFSYSNLQYVWVSFVFNKQNTLISILTLYSVNKYGDFDVEN